MEKLQPLITHRFWILLGIALILPFVGWWMGSGELQADIDTNRGTLDGAFNLTAGTPTNQTWTDQLKKFNDVLEGQNRTAYTDLWELHRGLMVWPKEVRHLVGDVPYRAELTNAAMANLYRSHYKGEIIRVRALLPEFNAETGTGTLVMESEIPSREWGVDPPTSEEMWDAQEDVWLVEALINTLVSINRNAQSITEAPLRVVKTLALVGGSRSGDGGGGAVGGTTSTSSNKSGGGGGGARGGGGGGSDPSAMMGASMNQFGGGGGGGGESGLPEVEIDFSVADEFLTEKGRYVDAGADLPYRTRGFKLTLVVDHQLLPEIMGALGRCVFPIRVERVHIASLEVSGDSDGGRGNNGGGGGAGPGGAGFGGQPGGGGRGFGASGGENNGGRRSNTKKNESDNKKKDGLLIAALADPYLATITISGVMVMFKEPPADLAVADAGQPGAPAGQPGGQPGQPGAPGQPTGAEATTAQPEAGAQPVDATATGETTPAADGTDGAVDDAADSDAETSEPPPADDANETSADGADGAASAEQPANGPVSPQ